MAASSSSQMPDDVMAEAYIGSYVSLTTKNDIRYEGFVFRIDTQTRSIFLRNVKAFGTEGRTTNGPQVPPSNIIMDSIIFQSNDLKDVRVISLPNARNNPSDLPDDPAIIHTRPPFPSSTLRLVTPDTFHRTNGILPLISSRTTYVSFSPVPCLNSYRPRPPVRSYLPFLTRLGTSLLPPPAGFSFHNSTLQQQQPRQPSILTAVPYNSGPPTSVLQTSRRRPIHISSFEPLYTSVDQNSFFNPNQQSGQPSSTVNAAPPPMVVQTSHDETSGVTSSTAQQPAGHPSSRDVKAENEAKEGTQKAGEAKLLPEPQNIRVYVDEAASSSRYGNRRHNESQVSQPVTKFAEDFDFEAMNRKFNKAEIWDTLSKNNPSEDAEKGDENDIYRNETPKSDHLPDYQKDDHFYDSISCHTKQQKISSFEMDKLNAETFGVQNPQRDRNLSSHGRGRSSQGSYRGRGSKNA